METITGLKIVEDNFQVEYEIIAQKTAQKRQKLLDITDIDEKINLLKQEANEIDVDLARLTSYMDKIDCSVAIACGVLTGMLDIFWVGEFSLERGKSWSSEKVNNFVKFLAKKTGYEDDDLQGAIRYLEKYGTPSDSVTSDLGGGKQHHLRDFAHHPTVVGLSFSILTQFTSTAYGTDAAGNFITVPIKDTSFIGKDLKQKFLFGVVYWFLHMASDVAGSQSTPGKGTGLPGPILSLLKEISALPFFNDNEKVQELRVKIAKIFNGTFFAKRDKDGKILKDADGKPLLEQIDLRGELGIASELGRQSVPIVINECMVRAFYFVRRLIVELKDKEQLKNIDWKKSLPFKNRTITRMLLVSSGTFTAMDLGEVAIRTLDKYIQKDFAGMGEVVLRINFVGVGRFAIACGADMKMGVNKIKLNNKKITMMSQQMHLTNAKVFYKHSEVWEKAEDTEQAIAMAYEVAKDSCEYAIKSWETMHADVQIEHLIPKIEKKNPGLTNRLKNIL